MSSDADRVEDQGFAGPRVAAQEVGVGGLLEFLGDAVGDLLLDLLRRGARPRGLDDHDAEGEGWVFGLRDAKTDRLHLVGTARPW